MGVVLNFFRLNFFCFFLFFGIGLNDINAQNLLINEVQSSNINTIYDHLGETPDWIELYNNGDSTINLNGFGLSDVDSLPMKWTLPAIALYPNSYLLVFASGLDLKTQSLNWQTIIDLGDEWSYLVPLSEPETSWKNIEYDDSGWLVGKSGFGYGDGDDSTLLDKTMSVFIRREFNVVDKDNIRQAYLHMDFDDSFVAYINGVEVARANIGQPGLIPAFDQGADNYDHEAKMYKGGQPDKFLIESASKYLKEGKNILAIQVHNHSLTSSDMTAIPIFTLGSLNSSQGGSFISEYINLVPVSIHTNFKIKSEGENLILSDASGITLDSLFTGKIPADISFGRKPDGSETFSFFNKPTPGKPNSSIGFSPIPVSKVIASLNGGFYQSGINILLEAGNPDDSIFYTLDGSEPGTSDSLYYSPINFTKTTTLRARVILRDYLPEEILTNTYFINESNNLPIVSVNTDPYNLWDEEYGIYVMGNNASSDFPHKGANFWEDWERPANIAMYEPDGTLAFQLDAGIKIFGNYSRGLAQKSISIHSRKSYGVDGINYKIFVDRDISKFKTIILRNSGNDFNKTMLRDAYANRMLESLDLDHQAYRPAIVYINGKYWGIQNIREKINEEFIAYNHGIEEDLIDILEFNGSVVKGNSENYMALLQYLNTHNLSSKENYNYVKNQIDVENYIKYQVANIFIDNQDWPGNNIKYWRERSPQGKWRWILFDLDAAFSAWFADNKSFNTLEYALDPNGPGWPNPAWSTFLFRKMIENQSFKYDFINCFADNLNTIFKSTVLENHLNEMKSVIEPEIQSHLNRWEGGTIDNWENKVSKIRTFVRERQRYVRGHIRKEFNLSGTYNINVKVEGGGHIQLNTLTLADFPWQGVYFNDVPINIEAIPNPGYKFIKWDGIETIDREHLTLNTDSLTSLTAIFVPYQEVSNEVIINEINYNSSPEFDPGDWVELLNKSDHSINMTGWVLKDGNDDHTFIMPEGTVINAHGFLTIGKNREKFASLFPDVELVDGNLNFGFDGGGECIRLFTSNEMFMDKVCYENDDPWPADPNGNGPTLALMDSESNNEHPANWVSSIVHGTPGAKNQDVITDLKDQFHEIAEVNEVSLYPNPTRGYVTLKIQSSQQENVSISLFDVTGRTSNRVLKYVISEGTTDLNLNLKDFQKDLPLGIYILRIESNSIKKRLRVVVQ